MVCRPRRSLKIGVSFNCLIIVLVYATYARDENGWEGLHGSGITIMLKKRKGRRYLKVPSGYLGGGVIANNETLSST